MQRNKMPSLVWPGLPLAAALLSVVAVALSHSARAAAPAAGTVSGTVTLEGEADGRVVVYIETAAQTAKAPEAPVTVVQKNVAFQSKSIVVLKDQRVEFPNEDAMYHNVFSVSPGNNFDLGLYRKGHARAATMRTAGEVDVYCNIHPNMSMKILVLQNEHYATTSSDGSFTLIDLPPGKYTLVAWSAAHVPMKREIQVAAGGTVKADFALKRRKESTSHLNKFGEQYGRYK